LSLDGAVPPSSDARPQFRTDIHTLCNFETRQVHPERQRNENDLIRLQLAFVI